jgi:hypothetical protein
VHVIKKFGVKFFEFCISSESHLPASHIFVESFHINEEHTLPKQINSKLTKLDRLPFKMRSALPRMALPTQLEYELVILLARLGGFVSNEKSILIIIEENIVLH